jgi:N-acetylglucosamine-6-phosphate deacetylase
MNEGELLAWHYDTRQPVLLRWADGKIVELATTTEQPPRDRWVAPPLVDLQVNGFAGIDFQQDDLTTDALLQAVRGLHRDGCGRFLLTLISDEWPRLMARLGHLRRLRETSAELRHAIAGWHVEGPFLSSEPGYRGAHRAEVMCDPKPEQIEEMRAVAGEDLVMLTLAPERLDAIAAIGQATALGIKISLGHTNAPAKRLTQAIRAGAIGFTHLGNGCPRELDRFDNILWRMFETPKLMVSLIPDGVHVAPALFRLMHREIGADRIYFVSDAMAAGGAPTGRYRLAHLELEVGEDSIVRLPGTGNLAGSALRPIDGVFKAASMLDADWQTVWPRYSDLPAGLMRLPRGLVAGASADFCVLEVTPESWLEDLKVYVRGKEQTADGVKERP